MNARTASIAPMDAAVMSGVKPSSSLASASHPSSLTRARIIATSPRAAAVCAQRRPRSSRISAIALAPEANAVDARRRSSTEPRWTAAMSDCSASRSFAFGVDDMRARRRVTGDGGRVTGACALWDRARRASCVVRRRCAQCSADKLSGAAELDARGQERRLVARDAEATRASERVCVRAYACARAACERASALGCRRGVWKFQFDFSHSNHEVRDDRAWSRATRAGDER